MGGEPTFVSDRDPDGAEWTIDALGPTKRREAGKLIRRLMGLWSSGAALQYGAGTHYPGEQTPRWGAERDLAARWRASLGRPSAARRSRRGPRHCHGRDGRRLRAGPGRRPWRHARWRDAGLRGPAYFLMREGRLPANVVAPKPARPPTRRSAPACAACSARVWTRLSAMSMPLRRFGAGSRRRWQSEAWEMREGKISWCRATAPWAFACRLPHCPMSTRRSSRVTSPSPIRSPATEALPPHASLAGGPGEASSGRGNPHGPDRAGARRACSTSTSRR